MRYYHAEHENAYRKIVERGYTQWNDLFDQNNEWSYEHFQNRAFLERIIPELGFEDSLIPAVLEYGCGTGPAACFLAARGFQVDAFDLIPEAITIAKSMANERGVQIDFKVADICALPLEPVAKHYDLVLDSFCLQSIVTDQDRNALFTAVRARLEPDGHYVISTAYLSPGRQYGAGSHFDAATGICYEEVPAESIVDSIIEIDGRWYVPHRRHLTAGALRNELVSAGFHIVSMECSEAANIVCRLGTR